VNPATDGGTGTEERSGHTTDTVTPMQHQHGGEPAGMVLATRFMDSFLHQTSFGTGYGCYDRHRSVRLVVCFDLAIAQIAQSGLNSLKVIDYSTQLFSLYGLSSDL